MARPLRHAEPWAPLYRAGHAAVTAWARALNGFEVAGRGNVPDARGCLVVCNHLADPDGMYVGAALPPPPRTVQHLVTARHHESSSLVRELLLRLGLEPVRTDGTEISALRHARRAMQQGGIVVIYPEGVWYAGVTLGDVPEIVEAHLAGGRPVERLRYRWPEEGQ